MNASPFAPAFQSVWKRGFDLIVATAVLILASPLLLIGAITVWLSMGRPIFFSQTRPGHDGKPFQICKFRTMRIPRPGEGWFGTDNARLTLVGRILRKTSIDELPQLWNVLRGEMSLVGPRPLLMEYLEKYTPEQNRRHAVRPGITGLAQVNGRQEVRFSRRLELDVWYVDHWSIALDLKILWLTVWNVLFSRGVISGQKAEDVDDLGLTTDLASAAGQARKN